MSIIACLLALAASTSAAILPPSQLEHFFDSVLEEAQGLVTVNTKIPDYVVNSGIPFLEASVQNEGTSIRGPTILKRNGGTSGLQTAQEAHAEALVSLGRLDIDVTKLTVKLFGYEINHEIHFSLMDAEAPVTIDIFRNNLATCQVSVNVMRPIGHYVVHFGSQDPSAFVSGVFNYAISFLLKFIPVDASIFVDRYFLPDLTSRINRELTIAARRVAC